MAGPNPDEELERLRNLCRRGLPPVVVVTGSNSFYRHEAIELLLAAVPAEAELRRMDAVEDRGSTATDEETEEDEEEAVEPAESLHDVPELAELRGGGLFARTSFLCVRRGAKWWQRCAPVLAQHWQRFGKGCGLLLEADKLDRRRKVAAQLVTDLGSAVFEFRDLYTTGFGGEDLSGGELAKWVVRRGERLGLTLAMESAVLMVLQVGHGPAELVAELERLKAQFDQQPIPRPLQPADLVGRLHTTFASTPFEFADAVLERDRVRAQRSLRAMFDRGVRNKAGKRDTGGLFPFTTSWLWQSMAKIHEGLVRVAAGQRVDAVADQLAPGRGAQRLARQLTGNDLASLRHGMLALHHVQRLQRTTGEADDVMLERFLVHWFDRRPVPDDEEFDA
jgi:hypothetical protein